MAAGEGAGCVRSPRRGRSRCSRSTAGRSSRRCSASSPPRISLVTVVTGHLAEPLEELVGDGSGYGVEACTVRQPRPDGSADAVRVAFESGAAAPAIVVAADTVFQRGDIALFKQRLPHREQRAPWRCAAIPRPARDALRSRSRARHADSRLRSERGARVRPALGPGPPRPSELRGLPRLVPYGFVEAYQRSTAGALVKEEIGSTRDLTRPLRLGFEELPYLEREMSETYDLFNKAETTRKRAGPHRRRSPSRRPRGVSQTRRRSARRSGLRISAFTGTRRPRPSSVMLDISPADDYAHYALGRCLEKRGRSAEANGHYKLARSLRPDSSHYACASSTRRLDAGSRAARASARVRVGDEVCGEIGAGLCILLGVARDDTPTTQPASPQRSHGFIFENEDGRFDRSLLDADGAALVVSQFTLIADTGKGNRPSFSEAALARAGRAALRGVLRGPPRARRRGGDRVFGARMEVSLVNDGPVTIILDVDWNR